MTIDTLTTRLLTIPDEVARPIYAAAKETPFYILLSILTILLFSGIFAVSDFTSD